MNGEFVGVKMTQAELRRLDEIARGAHVTRSEAIRRMIEACSVAMISRRLTRNDTGQAATSVVKAAGQPG